MWSLPPTRGTAWSGHGLAWTVSEIDPQNLRSSLGHATARLQSFTSTQVERVLGPILEICHMNWLHVRRAITKSKLPASSSGHSAHLKGISGWIQCMQRDAEQAVPTDQCRVVFLVTDCIEKQVNEKSPKTGSFHPVFMNVQFLDGGKIAREFFAQQYQKALRTETQLNIYRKEHTNLKGTVGRNCQTAERLVVPGDCMHRIRHLGRGTRLSAMDRTFELLRTK